MEQKWLIGHVADVSLMHKASWSADFESREYLPEAQRFECVFRR